LSHPLDIRLIVSKLTVIELIISDMTKSARSSELDPRHSPIYLGRRFFQIAHAAAAEAHDAIGLAPLEFGVLIQLHDRPGVDQNTLADRLALDRTTTSSIVFRLEQQGLIERAVNGDDRRARILRLAPAGVALHDRHRPAAQAAQERVMAVLTSAERKQLAELMTRVIDANQQYVRPGTIRRRSPKAKTAITR
jgi:DNA-binding MarR family transcriptional regulator